MKGQRALLVAGLLGCVSLPAAADDVIAGYDLWTTPPNGGVERFGTDIPAIPLGFFAPGSDPFVGTVFFVGQPIPTYLGQPTAGADTIVRRNVNALLPVVPSSHLVPIELVQLSLVSVAPIQVTSGGFPQSQWNVTVTQSPVAQSLGQMTIDHTIPQGGTFSAQLFVCPLLVFRRVGPPDVRQIDFCLDVSPAGQQIAISGQPWSHTAVLPLASPLSGPNFFAKGRSHHSGPHPDADPVEQATGLPVPVPSLGGLGIAAAVLLLLAAAVVALRRAASA